MIYLIFTSVATHEPTTKDLMHLLQQCRENNERNGITGLLLYHNRQFMQLIEGHDEDVMRCFHRLSADARHTDVIQLVRKPIRQRTFFDWSMSFQHQSLELNEDETGVSPFLSQPFSTEAFGSGLHEGHFLLLSFKNQMRQSAKF